MSDGGETRPSRRRWMIIALTVSLALNLFLLGAIVGTIAVIDHGFGPPGRFEHIVHRLNLKPAQMAAFRHFQETMRDGSRAMHEADMKVWTQIGNSATTTAQIGGLLDQTVQNRVTFQRQLADAAGKFLTALTPEERVQFIRQVRATRRHRGPPWLWFHPPHH